MKRLITSYLTGNVEAMTAQEYADFRAVVDIDGSRFFDAGPATPDEAAPDAPQLAPRTFPAPSPSIAAPDATAPVVTPAPFVMPTPTPAATSPSTSSTSSTSSN